MTALGIRIQNIYSYQIRIQNIIFRPCHRIQNRIDRFFLHKKLSRLGNIKQNMSNVDIDSIHTASEKSKCSQIKIMFI
jgi:hypothetical protein